VEDVLRASAEWGVRAKRRREGYRRPWTDFEPCQHVDRRCDRRPRHRLGAYGAGGLRLDQRPPCAASRRFVEADQYLLDCRPQITIERAKDCNIPQLGSRGSGRRSTPPQSALDLEIAEPGGKAGRRRGGFTTAAATIGPPVYARLAAISLEDSGLKSVDGCSPAWRSRPPPPSRCGLSRAELVESAGRRPSLTAAARGVTGP
jgi:hypothetical protein